MDEIREIASKHDIYGHVKALLDMIHIETMFKTMLNSVVYKIVDEDMEFSFFIKGMKVIETEGNIGLCEVSTDIMVRVNPPLKVCTLVYEVEYDKSKDNTLKVPSMDDFLNGLRNATAGSV